MKRYYQLWFKPNRGAETSPMQHRGMLFGTEYEVRRALAQLRSGYPGAAFEGWYVYDLLNSRWV
jgi:hypothetical protein